MPVDETCACCAALDALLLVLYDRGVSLMSMSRAAGRSKTAAQKRLQRISITQNLDLFYAGEDAPGQPMRKNRVGVGDSDYSDWIGSVCDTPEPTMPFALVKTGQRKISQWVLEDKRMPGRILTYDEGSINRVLTELGINPNNFSAKPVHPRDLVVRDRADLGKPVDVAEYVSVPANLLYVRGNPHTPKTAREALLSLPEPIQRVISDCAVARSVLEK
jgi:hypothetical protein